MADGSEPPEPALKPAYWSDAAEPVATAHRIVSLWRYLTPIAAARRSSAHSHAPSPRPIAQGSRLCRCQPSPSVHQRLRLCLDCPALPFTLVGVGAATDGAIPVWYTKISGPNPSSRNGRHSPRDSSGRDRTRSPLCRSPAGLQACRPASLQACKPAHGGAYPIAARGCCGTSCCASSSTATWAQAALLFCNSISASREVFLWPKLRLGAIGNASGRNGAGGMWLPLTVVLRWLVPRSSSAQASTARVYLGPRVQPLTCRHMARAVTLLLCRERCQRQV